METEIFWNAVSRNDSRFNGSFVYAVETTRIYCRPSCSSRLPKRENVSFYQSNKDAESNGFRACLRCRPNDAEADPQLVKVLEACRLLEEDPSLSLEDLSREIGVSAAHLQRTFKEIIGVSPKKFAENKRLERFKHEINSGSEVTAAMYDAGFGSSSRLYENVSSKLGMTPKRYAKKGINQIIDFTITDCELGKLLVARTEKGVCAVTFGDDAAELRAKLFTEYSNATFTEDAGELGDYVAAILGHIAGTEKTLDLPLDVRATAFQMRVWEILRKIPYGETLSYSEVAKKLGNPNAVRAVATACSSNRVALVIPCHRVVGKNGALSGYRWGVERKRELLEMENRKLLIDNR